MIEYIIESTLCLGVLYVTYELFFKKSTNYHINRFVLLLVPLFSLIVPLLNISIELLPIQNISTERTFLEILPVSNYVPSDSILVKSTNAIDFLNLSSVILLIYACITISLILRFVWYLVMLFYKSFTSEKVNFKGHVLSLIDEDVPPFTFFQSIFVNKKHYSDNKLKQELIIHEIAHKYQWHSLDIILVELLQVLFWFNPFIYLLKQKIKMNHEYLADDFVVRCGISSKAYANYLLNYTFPHKISGFASAFNNHKTIKNRLIMLSKFQEKKPKMYRLLVLIPAIAVLFISTAFNATGLPGDIQLSISQNDKLLENPGVLYADYLTWSSRDNEIYLKGKNVKIIHGDNDFTVNGRASYLGEVYHFVFNGQSVDKDIPINVSGKKCIVVKLTPNTAMEKYGRKARHGVVEITTTD